MSALNPVLTVGDQVADSAIVHQELDRREARDCAADLFERVGLDPARTTSYPHEFSGGMRQRVAGGSRRGPAEHCPGAVTSDPRP